MWKPETAADRTVCLVIVLALAVHAALGVHSARRMSVTHDEFWHLPVGLLTLKTGRFDLDTLNPPLTRLWCALPLAATPAVAALPADAGDPAAYGLAFLEANRDRYVQDLLLARCMNLALSLLTGLLLSLWSWRMFGAASAVCTVLLWAACPNFIANGALVTPDLGLTLFCVATAWAVWEYARQPTWRRALLLGLLLGLAQATKFTAVLLYLLCPLMWLALRGWHRDHSPPQPETGPGRRTLILQWSAALALSVTVLNATYLFRGSLAPFGSYRLQSQTLRSLQAGLPLLRGMPVPVPRDYLAGLDRQRQIMEQPHPVFLDGVWSVHGFASYYVMTLLYKLPHSLHLAAALAALYLAFSGNVPRLGRTQLFLALPPAALLAVASSSGMQLGVRYVLPALAFLMLFAGQVGRWIDWKQARLRTAAVIVTLLLTPLALRHHPDHLAYFNELAGGPLEGRSHLLDSNLDWGQSLGALKKELDQRGIEDVGLAYFGTFPPSEMGIRYHLPPSRAPLPGWYAVSVNFVQGRPHTVCEPDGHVRSVDLYEFGYFQFFKPVASIGYSIDLYYLSPADVGRWYAELRRLQDSAPHR